jgi:hypothetical protein
MIVERSAALDEPAPDPASGQIVARNKLFRKMRIRAKVAFRITVNLGSRNRNAACEIAGIDESKFFRPQRPDFPQFAQEKIWKNLQSQTVSY